MKKIKLTESTLKRIVERVVMEQKKEEENKELITLFTELKKDPNNQPLKDKIAELTKKLGIPTTEKGKEELNI
jgi:thioredoxin reductase